MLTDKKALVTGGSRGIGKAIVKQLAESGCSHILLTDIAFPDGEDACASEIQKEISNSNTNIIAFKADASSLEDAHASIEEAVNKMGGLDILVNNAGITKDNLLLRMSEKEFDDVININLKSVFNYSKAVLKPMIKQRYGRIVIIASIVGLIGNPGQSNYVASKAGVIGFTKSLARELASRNITVNAVAPGFIKTEMTDKLNEEQKANMLKSIPLKRLGTPEDIAKVVGFLCSPEADYITGQILAVDGGMTM
ncbi:MAG: 3-oxoacyl-[acyl-carrier-protein] reductase [Ignavibacterium sp.]|nr:MAG: 3-oxoacyl-[acyl-carrier-protein] reductase [Ignavibacterium sp.]